MWADIFLMAFRSIRQNTMRSALTILGIVIGVGSVAALVTIGQGAAEQVAAEISAMGENMLIIRPGAPHKPGAARAAADPMTLADAQAIAREISGLDIVAPSASAGMLVIYGNANWSTSVTGGTDAHLSCLGFHIASGRTFTAAEETGMRPVCILGATAKEKLFDRLDPIGERVRIKKMPCTVIGTLAARGQNAMGMDQDDFILLPIRVFQRRIVGNENISRISVTVNSGRSTMSVKADIESLLRERRGIQAGAIDDFEVRDLQEIASVMQETTSVMTTLLSAIAAVSLLVGGIGIMNIMLVSVTERTREIGIRLAIGALRSEVRIQFLVEAAVLSGFGGVIGLIVGFGGAWWAARVLEMPFVPSPAIALIALLFSVAVGIVFGFLPAHRASQLEPVEALRHE